MYVCIFLCQPAQVWNFSFPVRDRTCTLCTGSMESSPLNHQQSPQCLNFCTWMFSQFYSVPPPTSLLSDAQLDLKFDFTCLALLAGWDRSFRRGDPADFPKTHPRMHLIANGNIFSYPFKALSLTFLDCDVENLKWRCCDFKIFSISPIFLLLVIFCTEFPWTVGRLERRLTQRPTEGKAV